MLQVLVLPGMTKCVFIHYFVADHTMTYFMCLLMFKKMPFLHKTNSRRNCDTTIINTVDSDANITIVLVHLLVDVIHQILNVQIILWLGTEIIEIDHLNHFPISLQRSFSTPTSCTTFHV